MNVRHIFATSLCAGGVFLGACSTDLGPSCGTYYDTVVATLNQCGLPAFSIPTERSNYQSYCNAISRAPGIDNLIVQIDACSRAVQSAGCSFVGADRGIECPTAKQGECWTTAHCDIKGSLPDDAPCGIDAQCAGGVCQITKVNVQAEFSCGTCTHFANLGDVNCFDRTCDPQTGSCIDNVCTAYARQGTSCAVNTCAAPLVCDQQSLTCQPLPAKGEACTSTSACAEPFRCVNQTCADAVQLGGACPTGVECATGLFCDSQTLTCEKPQLGGVGALCGPFTCQPGLTCIDQKGGLPGVCVAPKQLGDKCNLLSYECAQFLFCIDGTCQFPDYSKCK